MYIYHALINALSAHMIHINLNMIFCTHIKHSPTKTIRCPFCCVLWMLIGCFVVFSVDLYGQFTDPVVVFIVPLWWLKGYQQSVNMSPGERESSAHCVKSGKTEAASTCWTYWPGRLFLCHVPSALPLQRERESWIEMILNCCIKLVIEREERCVCVCCVCVCVCV